MPGAAISLSDAISGYSKGLAEHAKSETQQLEAAKGDYESKIAAADKEESQLDPNALTPPKLPAAPTPQATSPIQVWGSSAMWLAALGGLLTRRPLTNSLNAAAGVMNAYRQQDAEAAKQQYETWKTETEQAVKMAQFSLDAYKTALSKIDKDKAGARADFITTAKSLGDENAAFVAEHYGIDAAIRYVDAQQAHVDRLTAEQPKIDEQNIRLQNYMGIISATKKVAAAKQSGDPKAIKAANDEMNSAVETARNFNLTMGKGGAAAASGDFTPEMGQLMAALAEQGVSLPTGFRTKQQQIQLYQGILERNPDKTPDQIAQLIKTGQIEFAAQKKETQTAAGTAGKVEVAQNEIKRFAPLVQEASDKVPRGQFVPLNQLMQTADAKISDPNLRSLKIRINSLLNAYDLLAARGGTDKDKREEVRNLLLSADSPEVLKASLDSFKLEADAAHAAAVEATRVPELPEGGKGGSAAKSDRGPPPAHLKGKPIWPSDDGTHWVFEDGSEAK